MMSDVNLVSALGPSNGPGSASSAAPTDAPPADGTFASLVDNAAAGGESKAGAIDPDADVQIDPHAVDLTSPDANEAQGIVAPGMLALPEWWLRGSPAACPNPADENEPAVDADESSDDEDEAGSGEIPLEGLVNLNWLLAQPVSRLPRNPSTDGAVENTQAAASAVGAGSLKGVNQPFARTWNMVASLDANAQTKAATPQAEPTAEDAAAAQPDLAGTVDALVAQTTPEVVAETAKTQPVNGPAGQSAAAVGRQPKPTGKVEFAAEAMAAQQRAAAAAVQDSASTALPRDASAAEVARPSAASAARLEQTSARLAKLIERSGGATIEAAGLAATVQPLDTSGGTSNDGSSAFAFTSRHDQAAAEPVRVGGTSTTPVFVVPHGMASTIAGMPSLVETPAAAPGAPLRDADMLQQFVQTMRVQFKDGIGDAVLRLRPEHLGEVSISLRVENGTVAATVNAEAAAVRQWLEANQASLRQSLSEQGLHLDRFVVQRDPDERPPEDQSSRQQQQRRQRNANANTPRFEITV